MPRKAEDYVALATLCLLTVKQIVPCNGQRACSMACASYQNSPCLCYSDGWLDCHEKNLTHIPLNMPQCSSLLQFENNSIKQIGAWAFSGMSMALTLKLSHNQISQISVGAFADMRNLHTLELNDNLIEHLDDCTFQGLVSLTVLHLHNNKIRRIGDRAFDGLPQLVGMNIMNNSISTLRNQWFQNKPNLATIMDAANPWNCTCQLRSTFSFILAAINQSAHCSPLGSGALFAIFNRLCITCSQPPELAGKKLPLLTDGDFPQCTLQTTASRSTRGSTAATAKATGNSTEDVKVSENSTDYCSAVIQQVRREMTVAKSQTQEVSSTAKTSLATTNHVNKSASAPLPKWMIALITISAMVAAAVIILLVLIMLCSRNNNAKQRHEITNLGEVRFSKRT